MDARYELWDVFTDRPFTGNPLAVVLDASELDAREMALVARELNLSETAFVLPPEGEGADARARYFTPATELPMAGHPTIGAAFALDAAGRAPGDALTLQLGVGPRRVRLERGADGRLERAWMEQGSAPLVASRNAPEERAALARALGLEPADLAPDLPLEVRSAGVPFLIVPLASRDALARAALSLAALGDLAPAEHRAVLAVVPGRDPERDGADGVAADVRCRMFGEALGMVEDPATGSAHGPLGAWMLEHGLVRPRADGVARFASRQGVEMGRPSLLHVEVRPGPDGPEVAVGGSAVRVGEGRIRS